MLPIPQVRTLGRAGLGAFIWCLSTRVPSHCWLESGNSCQALIGEPTAGLAPWLGLPPTLYLDSRKGVWEQVFRETYADASKLFLTWSRTSTHHVYLISISPNPKPTLTPVTQRDRGLNQRNKSLESRSKGKGFGLHLSVLEAAENVWPYFLSHTWPHHSRLSTKDPLWLVGRLLQGCLQTQCPAPAHTCSLTEGMSQYSSAKAGERQIGRHTEAPYMSWVCIVYITRLEINHSLVSLKVWGQPSVGALDFKNFWASFNGTVWSDSLAEKDFIWGAGVQVGQWGHATRARRGTGSAWLVYPGRSFSQLFMLWFKPLTVSLSHPSPRCEGCLWNKGLTELVLGKCGKVSFCHPQLKLHSLQNFIYSKVLIYPQTSCFAKYTTLLLEQGCGFRVWVVPFLLNAGRLCLSLSLLVPAHDGRQVGIQPGLSSSSGQSQCEDCRRQAFVWRISPGAPVCGEDLQEVCAHCQPRPIDWVSSLFYRLRGFMGSPKIYLHCQVSVMEGRTRRWIRREGTLIRRENPTLARPQLPEAETEGHKLLWTTSLDSRRWPVKPLSSSL